MDYQRHYDLLIEKYGTWKKPKGVYVERHRKLPGCMGGKYVKGNAFYMSSKAHYVAHLLLARIKNIPPLWNAIVSMGGLARKTTSASYERAKIKVQPYLKKHGLKCRDNNLGFHAWTKEMWKEHGNLSKHKKIGIFDPAADPSAAAKLGGTKAALLGLGPHTFEGRSAAGKKGVLSAHKAVSENRDSKDRQLKGAIKANLKQQQLWKIPEYKKARLEKDVETYRRITREFES